MGKIEFEKDILMHRLLASLNYENICLKQTINNLEIEVNHLRYLSNSYLEKLEYLWGCAQKNE